MSPGDLPEQLEAMLKAPRLTLLVNDPQRDTPTHVVSRALATVRKPERIRVLVATGSHRFSPAQRRSHEAYLRNSLGDVQIQWHDSRSEELVLVGRSWKAHPWLLDGRCDLLAVGSVEPHYFAGFTGAHKTLTIGTAGYQDIQANHSQAVSSRCQPGRLEDNPVHRQLVVWLDELEGIRPVSTANLVQSGEQLLGLFCGEPLETLNRAAKLAGDHFICRHEAHFDAVVASVEGALSRSFYQADKAIKNNEWSVKPGGALVLVADCDDGMGQDAFCELLRQAADVDQALSIMERRGYRLGDHKAIRLRYLTDPTARNIRLFIVSRGLDDSQIALLGARHAGSVAEALDAAGIDEACDRVLRVPDAGNRCNLCQTPLTSP
ncbi:MAG: lactate racemase domain-containing protein [Phycisphaerae bacterium]